MSSSRWPRRNKATAPAVDRRRRLLSGRTVSVTEHPGRTWHDLIRPGPAATGGARADRLHPSRKHDVTGPDHEYLVTHDLNSDRASRRAFAAGTARSIIRARRAEARDEVQRGPGPMPSRAVQRWAAREYVRDVDSPLLAQVRALHQDAAAAQSVEPAITQVSR
jgi:hypothetical protein